MRGAVTGATGFLGGHLVRRLLAEGHEVIAVVRDPAKAAGLGAQLLVGDLTRPIETDLTADAFVHAAALSSTWGPRADFVAANVTGTDTAVALARRMGVRRFVHISSPSLYFRFADQLGVREDDPLPPPVNAYAESKRLAEVRVLAAPDLNPVILRPRGIYGRGDTALLPRLVRAARRGPLPLLRAGQAVTDITHVDDVVAAIVAALATPTPPVAINISGGQALPIRDVAEAACAHAGVPVRWRALPTSLAFAGVRLLEAACALWPGRPEPVATAYSLGIFAYSQTLDISRAAELLGWRPQVSFAEGLGRL